jgi:putative addiction module component (TIGR02574 family)
MSFERHSWHRSHRNYPSCWKRRCPFRPKNGVLIGRLIASLDEEAPEEGLEAAWDDEIKRRVDDIRSGRVKTIPGEQVLRELAEEFR